MRKYLVIAASMSLIGVLAMPAGATVSLNYLGAFKCSPGVYDGDLAYCPSGNGGAGSLFVTDGSSTTRKELSEISLATPVNSTVPASLNSATTLHAYDCPIGMQGLTYSASDAKLYNARFSGNQGFTIGAINTDGTAETDNVAVEAWTTVTTGAGIVDTTAISGYDKLVVSNWNSAPNDVMMVAVNTSTGTKKTVLQYTTAHPRTSGGGVGTVWSAELIGSGADATLVVSDMISGVNTLLFYNLSDIVNAANLYDAQPYASLSVQDTICGTLTGSNAAKMFGLAYDSTHQVLYSVEGAYGSANYVHAWSVVPEPATLALLLAGGLIASRRRHA